MKISETLNCKELLKKNKNIYNFGLGSNPLKQPEYYINKINENLRKDLELLKNFDFSFQSLYLKSNYGFLQWLLN